MLFWLSAHQLDYIPASLSLGCKYPLIQGCQAKSKERVRWVHMKTRRVSHGATAKGRFLQSSGSWPLWYSLPCNCEPSLKECQGRVAVSGSCTTAACPCLESVQSIRHWLREETGSTQRVFPHSWTRSRAPDSLSQSLSRSGFDPKILEATGSGREKQQRENTLTCLDVTQHAGFFLTCWA